MPKNVPIQDTDSRHYDLSYIYIYIYIGATLTEEIKGRLIVPTILLLEPALACDLGIGAQ